MPKTIKTKAAPKEVKTTKNKVKKTTSKVVAQEVTPAKQTSSNKDSGFSSKIKGFKPQNISLKSITSYRPSKAAYILLLAIGLLLLASYKKNWFVAATVNNAPVSNFELQSRLNKLYREQVLTQMINEKILLSEARKNGITVSDADIDNKVKEVETKVGGAQSLDSLLSSQGQTKESFRDQLKFQIIIEKMYAKDATVSAEEVKTYVEQNKDQLQATNSAGQEKEAQEALQQDKLSKTFSEKFQQLKQSAQIRIF